MRTQARCPSCGTTFKPRDKRHRYCSKRCRGRDNPVKRSRCRVCSKKFAAERGKLYCRDACRVVGEDRRSRGLPESDKAKSCRICGKPTRRRSRKGPWPTVCGGSCNRERLRGIQKRWIRENPERYAEILKRHRERKKALRKSLAALEQDVVNLDKERTSFVLDLFEVCHEAFLAGRMEGPLVAVSVREIMAIKYPRQPDVNSAVERFWERWKGRLRKLGLVKDYRPWRGEQRYSVYLDYHNVVRASDNALGVVDDEPIE